METYRCDTAETIIDFVSGLVLGAWLFRACFNDQLLRSLFLTKSCPKIFLAKSLFCPVHQTSLVKWNLMKPRTILGTKFLVLVSMKQSCLCKLFYIEKTWQRQLCFTENEQQFRFQQWLPRDFKTFVVTMFVTSLRPTLSISLWTFSCRSNLY